MQNEELIKALRCKEYFDLCKDASCKYHVNGMRSGCRCEIKVKEHDAADALETAGKAQRWVPCSERLPEKDGFYNVVMNGGVWGEPDVWSATSCGFYDGMWDEDGTTITHWMLLPEAPKEDDHADS